MYDVVVAGGSISGLLCAREVASHGHSVLVLEKNHEIGTPDHCGGMTSESALDELGLTPNLTARPRRIGGALVHSPTGKSFEVGASGRRIIGLDRRELDKQAARQAQRAGAQLRVGEGIQRITPEGVVAGGAEIKCRLTVDARGVSTILKNNRSGALQSAQYEVCADWIRPGTVELVFDSVKYPGFFAWVIPISHGVGKVGAAGRGINAAAALDDFLTSRGASSVLRKIFAPVWVGGPAEKFVEGGIVTVGDAAGQTKPTTAGGIFSCGMGGVLAGEAISEYLDSGDRADLESYQRRWKAKFGGEFARQALARRLLGRLDNTAIDALFDLVRPEVAEELSGGDDFDFHAGSIIRLLGARSSIRTVQAILGSEARKLLG